MRLKILTMSRSSQDENSKHSILVNELNRRFEVMDNLISDKEKVEKIDHFVEQLYKSGHNEKKMKESS